MVVPPVAAAVPVPLQQPVVAVPPRHPRVMDLSGDFTRKTTTDGVTFLIPDDPQQPVFGPVKADKAAAKEGSAGSADDPVNLD